MDVDDPTAVCRLCGTAIDFEDGAAVSLVARRSGRLDDDGEPWFRETQEVDFCGLVHANEWLARDGLPDTWEVDDDADEDSSVLGAVGCALALLVFLAVVAAGTVTSVQWAWDMLT